MGLETPSPFLQIAPGLVAQALALPERGIGEALGPPTTTPSTCPLQATIGHREAELLAIGLSGAQVKTCVRSHATMQSSMT